MPHERETGSSSMCVAKPHSGTFPPSSETRHMEVIVWRRELLQAQGDNRGVTPNTGSGSRGTMSVLWSRNVFSGH